MAITQLHSYDLNGNKDSFSELISNISPDNTILVSYSKKEGTPTTKFKWQIDSLDPVIYDLNSSHEVLEGVDAADYSQGTNPISVKATEEKTGNTQIFYHTFSISDSALATSVHGRKGELQLQILKSGKQLKVIMEKAFSSKQALTDGSDTQAQLTGGLYSQIAALDLDNPNMPDPTTIGLKTGDFAVHKEGAIDFDTLDSICLALYRNGSEANVILVNPVNYEKVISADTPASGGTNPRATFSAGGQDVTYETKLENGVTRSEVVPTFRDSFGGIWEIRKSRFMPTDIIYFLNPEDIKQRVLREPKASKLGKQGNFETWQLVIEAGLQLSNPFAAGVLDIK